MCVRNERVRAIKAWWWWRGLVVEELVVVVVVASREMDGDLTETRI